MDAADVMEDVIAPVDAAAMTVNHLHLKPAEKREEALSVWQKEQVINELKRRGKRMTKQRLLLLDIILEGKYSCGKEIYYDAIKVDPTIGLATVYRMLATLEEIGAVNRCYQCSLEQRTCNYEAAEAG